ncbi:hypothetical protein [Bradyrhizobium sp. Ai1a-2]|uniref:hypothetical protein n=1 Tax=Bradyrhizobium sp. Ai1a-2 TaxID=196490 RepID=UPI000409AD15|nr:hypothetical protein [Bradyrhizobium sp. Ai1a-2]
MISRARLQSAKFRADHAVTHEQALQNAIVVLREWSEEKAETSAVLAAIAELMATKPSPKPPQKQKLSS